MLVLVILNNFATEYLAWALTSKITRCESSALRLSFCAILSALFTATFPIINIYYGVARFLVVAVSSIILKPGYISLGTWSTNMITYALVSFAFLGATYMFSSSLTSPLAVCGGITVVLACSRYLINKLNKLRIERQTTLLAEIILDYGLLQCTAYYDTGNTLYDKNNHPVVVICGKLAEKLPFDVIGDIAISSVTGIKILPLINLRLKVYYSDHKHKLYDVHAAISNEMRRMHDIILHRDMGE